MDRVIGDSLSSHKTMPSFDSGRAGSIGGWNIEARRADSLNGIRFDSNRADPGSLNDVILYRGAGASLRFWDGL